MSVTLDVSKLSGWLNALAYCRAERRAYDAGRGAGREMGGPRAMAAQSACRGGPDYRLGGPSRGGAHVEHVAHVGDAGGVEDQRLVERPRILPRVERRRTMRDEVQAEGGRRLATAAQAVCRGGLDCRLEAGHGEERTENM